MTPFDPLFSLVLSNGFVHNVVHSASRAKDQLAVEVCQTMTPANSAAVNGWSRLDALKPLASWYTEGVSDGVGDRLWMCDNSGKPSLELLRCSPMLATANGFEDALRERVDALHAFDHPAFSRVRAIQRLDRGDLALVSTFTTGRRVSEIFWK